MSLTLGPLSDVSFGCFAEQTVKIRGKEKRKHRDVLFILPADLVEPQKTAASTGSVYGVIYGVSPRFFK